MSSASDGDGSCDCRINVATETAVKAATATAIPDSWAAMSATRFRAQRTARPNCDSLRSTRAGAIWTGLRGESGTSRRRTPAGLVGAIGYVPDVHPDVHRIRCFRRSAGLAWNPVLRTAPLPTLEA